MSQIVKQVAIGVAGGIVTVLLIALWNWISVGGLIQVLGGATQAEMGEVHHQVTVLESSMDSIREGNHECEWVSIGYDKSHGQDMTGWCSEDSFIRQIDIDGCDDGGNCPFIGRVRCCEVLP